MYSTGSFCFVFVVIILLNQCARLTKKTKNLQGPSLPIFGIWGWNGVTCYHFWCHWHCDQRLSMMLNRPVNVAVQCSWHMQFHWLPTLQLLCQTCWCLWTWLQRQTSLSLGQVLKFWLIRSSTARRWNTHPGGLMCVCMRRLTFLHRSARCSTSSWIIPKRSTLHPRWPDGATFMVSYLVLKLLLGTCSFLGMFCYYLFWFLHWQKACSRKRTSFTMGLHHCCC